MSANRLAVVFCTLFLAGCSTAVDGLNQTRSTYVGQHVDRFFIERGPAGQESPLSNGEMLYLWRGGQKTYVKPNASIFHANPSMTIECSLRIHADAKGIIRNIYIENDTTGAWNTSRCAEVLSRPADLGR